VLAEGQAGTIDVSESMASARAEIEAAVGRIVWFLEAVNK
jgi:hypothetical protein